MRTRVKGCFSVLNTWARTPLLLFNRRELMAWPVAWFRVQCWATSTRESQPPAPQPCSTALAMLVHRAQAAHGLGRVRTAGITTCTVFFVFCSFLGTKLCAIKNRIYFSSEKTLWRLRLHLFFLLCQDRQLPPAQHSQPHAGCQSCFSFSQHLSHKQTYQLLYIHASAYRSLWQE